MKANPNRSDNNQRVAIVVGGGPAPGINGAIGAVTLEAGNRGHEVVGIYDGFSHLMAGRTDRTKILDHDDVSRIHSPAVRFSTPLGPIRPRESRI
jgi:6-phosphofructokinase